MLQDILEGFRHCFRLSRPLLPEEDKPPNHFITVAVQPDGQVTALPEAKPAGCDLGSREVRLGQVTSGRRGPPISQVIRPPISKNGKSKDTRDTETCCYFCVDPFRQMCFFCLA